MALVFRSLASLRNFAGRLVALSGLCLLAACASLPAPEPESLPAEVPPASPVAVPLPSAAPDIEPEPAPVRISVAAVGDLMIGTDFPKNTLPDDDGRRFLAAAKPLLDGVDLALGNLEGVLMDAGTPVKRCQNPALCYLFRSPARYAAHFADAGFDALSLANNHARDFGELGRSASMAALDGVGIAHTGRIGDVAYLERQGRRVAVIGFAPNPGAHSLNDIAQAAALVRQQAEQVDIVIVLFHGGAEGAGAETLPFATEIYQGEDRGDVVAFSHAMVDAGADLVFGSGPHVPRALELYQDRLIAYSLGNFATHFGIGIGGNRGLAPLVTAELDGDGRFQHGQLTSFIQLRPDGPQLDPAQQALQLIRRLTEQAFPGGDLAIGADGRLSRKPVIVAAPPGP